MPPIPGFSRPDREPGDVAVDQALTRLTGVGKAERHLDEQHITRISQLAAQERRRTGEPALLESPILEPTGPGSSSRPHRRALVLAAAVLVVAAFGVAQALSRPGQLVVTQEPGSAAEPAPRPAISVDADALAGAAARTPDSASASTSTSTWTSSTSSVATSTTRASSSTTIPSSAGSADDPVRPTTTPDSTETGPGESDSTETDSAEATAPGPESPGSDPEIGSRDAVSIPIGEAGAVWLAVTDSSPTVVDLRPRTGWADTIDADSPPSLDVVLTRQSATAGLVIRSDQTGFQLIVDPGQDLPEGYSRSRTFDFDDAGSVTVEFDVYGLAGLDVDVGPGWAHNVSTPAPDHLDVRLIGPRRSAWRGVEIWIGDLWLTVGTGP